MELTPEYEALATAGAGRATLWQTLRARLREHFTLLKFITTGTGGYIVYQLVFLTVVVNLLILRFGVTPYLVIPTGMAVGFLWNWTWDWRFIWRPAARRNEAG